MYLEISKVIVYDKASNTLACESCKSVVYYGETRCEICGKVLDWTDIYAKDN